jgi:hypothetical protein
MITLYQTGVNRFDSYFLQTLAPASEASRAAPASDKTILNHAARQRKTRISCLHLQTIPIRADFLVGGTVYINTRLI